MADPKRKKEFVGVTSVDYWAVLLVLLQGPLLAARLGQLAPERSAGDVVTYLRDAGLDLPCYKIPNYGKVTIDDEDFWFDESEEGEAEVYLLSQDDAITVHTWISRTGGRHGD